MAELCAGVAGFVLHPEASRDLLGGDVVRIDDGDDARPLQDLEHVSQRSVSRLCGIAAAPGVAREHPSNLQVGGRAKRLNAGQSDETSTALLDHRAHAYLILGEIACVADQSGVDILVAERLPIMNVAGDFRVLEKLLERWTIGVNPRTYEETIGLEAKHAEMIAAGCVFLPPIPSILRGGKKSKAMGSDLHFDGVRPSLCSRKGERQTPSK